MSANPVPPTMAINWLKCPTYGHLTRNWETIQDWKPHLDMGIALHKGIASLLMGKGMDWSVDEVGLYLAEAYRDQDDWSLEALLKLAQGGLKACLGKNGLVKSVLDLEEVLATELDLDFARADLVTSRGLDLILTDHKVSLSKQAHWIDKELLEVETDWQLYDYCIRYHRKFGRYPNIIRRHILALSPKPVSRSQEFEVTPEQLEAWARGAELVWKYIWSIYQDSLQDLPMNLPSCHGKYGKCEFYDACHLAGRDPEKMKMFYREKVKYEKKD